LYKFKDSFEENVVSLIKVEEGFEEGDETLLGRLINLYQSA